MIKYILTGLICFMCGMLLTHFIYDSCAKPIVIETAVKSVVYKDTCWGLLMRDADSIEVAKQWEEMERLNQLDRIREDSINNELKKMPKLQYDI